MVQLTWDKDTGFKASSEFIRALKNLMIAEIKMMRKNNKMDSECWFCGSVKIHDLANSGCFEFQYGGKEDKQFIKEFGDIFVSVPF